MGDLHEKYTFRKNFATQKFVAHIFDEFVTFFVKLKWKFSFQPFLKDAEVGRLGEIHVNDSKVGYNEFDFF